MTASAPANVKFPVGGEREPVFTYLMHHGFVMSGWSDKHWERADGVELHLYGAGSRARILDKDGNQLADDVLEVAVNKLRERT